MLADRLTDGGTSRHYARPPRTDYAASLNLDDFLPAACEPLGVKAIHPDELLLDLYDLNPDAVRAALEQQGR